MNLFWRWYWSIWWFIFTVFLCERAKSDLCSVFFSLYKTRHIHISNKIHTIVDFFALKSETGIRSRCVGRFNVGSGVTGIGSMRIEKVTKEYDTLVFSLVLLHPWWSEWKWKSIKLMFIDFWYHKLTDNRTIRGKIVVVIHVKLNGNMASRILPIINLSFAYWLLCMTAFGGRNLQATTVRRGPTGQMYTIKFHFDFLIILIMNENAVFVCPVVCILKSEQASERKRDRKKDREGIFGSMNSKSLKYIFLLCLQWCLDRVVWSKNHCAFTYM